MRSLQALLGYTLTDQQHTRILRWLGHLTFLALGILSLVYYKERMLHFDSAHYAFKMIYEGDFYTAHNRYINYFPQILALGVRHLGGSLQAILMTYSASFILLYYLIYLTILYLFKSPKGGLFLALACTLTVRYKFYAPVGEVMLGIPFIVLVMAWLMSEPYQRAGKRFLKVAISILLAASFLIIHPFPMITLGFCWLIWMSYAKRWKITYEWVLPFACLLMWSIKLASQGIGTSYEAGRLQQLLEAKQVLTNLSDYYVWGRLAWYIDVHYLVPLLLFLGAFLFLAYQKKWLSSILSLIAIIGLVAITIVLFAYLDAPIYILLDGYLAHVGVIMALVFVLSFGNRKALWAIGLFIFLLLFSVDRIKGSHHFFTQREQRLLSIMDSHAEPSTHKFLVTMNTFSWENLWLPWAIGVETLMMSTLETPREPKTLFFYEESQNPSELLIDEDLFLALHYTLNPYVVKAFPKQLKLAPGFYKKIDWDGK